MKTDVYKISNPCWAILLLGTAGLLRVILEVALDIKIHKKWWALDPDVIFTNVFFVIHFCFFGSLIFYFLLKFFQEKVPYQGVFLFLFRLQFLHLVIPFIDKVGLELDIPYTFKVIPLKNSPFFLAPTFMTFGIIIAWLVAGFLTLRFLSSELNINLGRSIVIIFVLFNFFYWPTYHFYNPFNTFFNLATRNSFPIDNVWGYGAYFMFASFLGILYFLKKKRMNDI